MKRRTFVKATMGAMTAAYLPGSRAHFPSELRAIGRTGEETVLQRAEIEELAKSLRRALLTPVSPRYDDARKIWNGIWDDKYPALIAQCADISDVINVVDFARTHDLLVAVRGGGHSISGKSICDGGIVLDMSPMRGVVVDPDAMTARVEGGALLHDMDRETQSYGLVVPAGVVSHTGIAGLTLGGGIGILMRTYGLTIDNLRSVEIVTPDGKLRRASEQENPDLFWGVRGGGGNFGVVTSFEFGAHRFGPEVLTGAAIYPRDEARDMLNRYFEHSLDAPDELHCFTGMTINEKNEDFAMIGFTWSGSFSDGERVIAPLLKLGKPVAEFLRPTNYVGIQSRGDAHNAHGRHYYIKGRYVNDFDPVMNDIIMERWHHAKGRFNTMRIVRFGGAVGRVDSEATAWPHRDAVWDLEVGASWVDPAKSEKYVNWGRDYWDALEPYTADTFYVNEIMDEEQDKVKVTYQGNYERLVQLKNKYDPNNLLQLNANVKPSV